MRQLIVLVVSFVVGIAPYLGRGPILLHRPTTTWSCPIAPFLALALTLILFIGSIELAENKRHDLINRHVEQW